MESPNDNVKSGVFQFMRNDQPAASASISSYRLALKISIETIQLNAKMPITAKPIMPDAPSSVSLATESQNRHEGLYQSRTKPSVSSAPTPSATATETDVIAML